MLAILLAACLIAPQESSESAPEFSFGVVADVQYADKDTAGDRHYRTSLDRFEVCVGDLETRDLSFAVQLGDLVDEPGKDNLRRVLGIWNRLPMPRRNVLGNHEFGAGPDGSRAAVQRLLGLTSGEYDFRVESWRFIVLDSVDVSPSSGRGENAPLKARAREWLANLNGGVSERQLRWLEDELEGAKRRGERVIVFTHLPLAVESSDTVHVLRNGPDVVERLERSRVVVAVFQGHDHKGGYARKNGIHYVTVQGMVEAPEQNAYGVVDVFQDRLEIRGIGKLVSRTLVFE